jgi:MFS family permease
VSTPRISGRRTLPAGPALAGAAITFTSMYLAAGALTPLLVVYKERFGFAPSMLTLAFAVYAIGFLAAVLTVGSLSDYLGRRPVLIGALVVQIASNLLFLFAADVGWVIGGRIVQGVASGAATSAFTAMLVEVAPAQRKRLGTILGSVGLTGGLGGGSLLAGFAIQFTSSANTIIFVVLTVATVLGIVVVAFSPESVARASGAARSLIPRISFPAATRREFAAAAPVVAAVWMLAGLSGGLAPSMVRSVFHSDSSLLGGFAGFVAPAVSAVIGLAFARVAPRRAMTIGIYASIVGAVGIITGVLVGSLAVMIVGQAIAGVGFGASFTASLRLIFPLAAAHQRAGVVAGIYLVSYLALGVPIVVEGQLAGPLGEVPAVFWYTAFTILLALISLVAQLRLKRGGQLESSQGSPGVLSGRNPLEPAKAAAEASPAASASGR